MLAQGEVTGAVGLGNYLKPPASGPNFNIYGAGPMVTLDVPQPGGGMKPQTFRRDSPEAQAALAAGATETGATALSQVEVKALADVGQRYSTLDRLSHSFKKSYANTIPYVTEAQNLLGKKIDVGDFAEQSAWWRDYQSFRNEVRHSMFGGALTAHEMKEFEKADITEGMSASRIMDNLQKQLDIASKGMLRQASPLETGGKNKSQINSALGGEYIGKRFWRMGQTFTHKGKKYSVVKPGFDPEIREVE
jgi:hypothetical protein